MLFKKPNADENDLTCSNDPQNGQQGLTPRVIATCVILSLLDLIVLLGTIMDLILISQQQSIDTKTSNINGYSHFLDTDIAEPELIKPTKRSSYCFRVLIDPKSRVASLAEFSAIRTSRRIFTMKTKK